MRSFFLLAGEYATRRVALALVVGLLARGAAAAPGAAQPKPRKPNIVLIVVDDLGYGELSCQGNPQVPTPNIDSIAAGGVRFTNGYVSAPVCSPSRAGFMTGRYQTRFGHEFNAIGVQNREEDIGLPLQEKTLADLLKREGYATGLVGKWHLGASRAYQPLRRGFDEFYGFLHEGHFYVPPPYRGVMTWFRVSSLPEEAGERLIRGNYVFSTHMGNTEPPYDRENPILRGFQPVDESKYLTDAWAREAVAFIGRHATEPFFLYLAYNAPHSPMQATLAWMEKFQSIADIHRRIFAGMVGNLDASIGKVLEALRRHRLEDDTLVILFSDNGGPTRELTSSNAPLRAGKGHVYEGGIRIPFLIKWKGRLPAGKVYERPVISLDVAPTALAAAGAGERLPDNLDGVDLLPYLTGKNSGAPHRTLFWRYGNRVALREGDWKLVREPRRGQKTAPFELYNLAADIGEGRDLAAAHPEIVKRLAAELERYNRQMAAPLWRGRGSGARKNWPLELVR